MSDQNTPTEPADAPTSAPEPTTEPDAPATEPDAAQTNSEPVDPRRFAKVQAEAKSLRDRLRAAEETVTGLRYREVERAAERHGVKSEAILAVTALTDLLGDDGLPDDERIAAAAAEARDRLGIGRPAVPLRRGGDPVSGSGAPLTEPRGFAAAFAPREK